MVGKSYIEEIVDFDAEASKIMYDASRRTFPLRTEIDILDDKKGGLVVLRPDKNRKIALHSASADPGIDDIAEYSSSLIRHLRSQAANIGATPIAFTNIIERSDISLDVIEQVADAFLEECKKYKLAIMNGENAWHGYRVNAPVNISGTMISYIDAFHPDGVFGKNGIPYIVLSPEGMPVYANSDGIGTKAEVYERTDKHEMFDAFAMLVDDAAKKAATVRALSFVLEIGNENVPSGILWRNGNKIAEGINAYFAIQLEYLRERIRGYGSAPYNIGGTCISFIDEEALNNLPVPKKGDVLVAIRDPENRYTFRCNGISAARKGFESLYGEEWHTAVFEGITLGNWAVAPSTVFYPYIKQLFNHHLISGFFHMSGGAYREKLAEPLKEAGLSAKLDNLFEPSPAMVLLANHLNMHEEELYRIWNMGNEAFVSTGKPDEVMRKLHNYGLEGRIAASEPLKKGSGIAIETYTGREIVF